MPLKKPSDMFQREKISLDNEEIKESFDQYKTNYLEKLNYFVGKLDLLSEQVSAKVDNTDLENAMLSQLMTFEDTINRLKSSYEGMSTIKNDVIREEFSVKLNNIAEAIDSNIEILNQKFEKSFWF